MEMADAAYKLLPFQRYPFTIFSARVMTRSFETRITVIFDRSIEEYFAAAAIWGLVNRVSLALLKGPVYAAGVWPSQLGGQWWS